MSPGIWDNELIPPAAARPPPRPAPPPPRYVWWVCHCPVPSPPLGVGRFAHNSQYVLLVQAESPESRHLF
jgi:hypothetical protein